MPTDTHRAAGSGTFLATAQRTPTLAFKGGTTNSSALTAMTAKLPTTTKPVDSISAGRKIIDPGSDNWLYVSFIGGDANNEKGAYGIWGWRKLVAPDPDKADLWIPFQLVRGAMTLSATPVGIAGSAIDDTWYFADTITVTTDNTYSTPGASVVTPADAIGWMFFDFTGAHLIELEMTINGDGTDMSKANALYWTL